ncbi:alkyl hydroperoxide reductase subunit D [Catenuloplanes nepalensis]|uniref:Alkyl hydroperoxide reductase AhpD n=1 Tax=Catenuloplanes nepalensis TaxID=587533 RepID=A0ABT9N0R0_9ACTN|nr:carboxymuconolactone decarboxylase family protein [Catenuloplanes nepalensis]MDP9797254.1 alkyl hydroperoxide reductase subunit D [Catenuloplanes nepalensis]
MNLSELRESLPPYADDLRVNLGRVLLGTPLTDAQAWGAALACAIAARQPVVIGVFTAEAAARLDAPVVDQARAAASIMAMNNVYYRAQHMLGGARHPIGLRMRAITSPALAAAGVTKADFELWCLAVSAIAGCEVCLQNHDQGVRRAGLDSGAVHEALRIAAVVHAAAVTLDAAG